MHECPNCGYLIEEDNIYVCPQCEFDFNDTFECPYKVSLKCIHTQRECDISGSDFELCKLYLHKAGIV